MVQTKLLMPTVVGQINQTMPSVKSSMRLIETRQLPPCGHQMPTNCPRFWLPIEDGFYSCDWTHMKGHNQTRTIFQCGTFLPILLLFWFLLLLFKLPALGFKGILVIGFLKKLWSAENKTSQCQINDSDGPRFLFIACKCKICL